MKYRPLCTSYLTEAIGRLEEVTVAEERPKLVIEQVIGSVEESSSESESDEVIQEVPMPPPRGRTNKRPLLPLDDDVSFEYIKPSDPMQTNDNDNRSESTLEKIETEEASSDDMPPNSPDDSIQEPVSIAKDALNVDDEIFSMDSSSVEMEAVQPFQLVHQVTKIKKKKRSTTFIPASSSRDPLLDTDDELDNVQSTEKRRLSKKKFPRVVDVSLKHSPVGSLPPDSQSQLSEEDDDSKDNFEQEVATMDEDDDNELALSPAENIPPLEDTAVTTAQKSRGTVEIPLVSQESAKMPKSAVTEYLPIEPATFIKIMQSLGYSQSRKRIAADPGVPIHRAVTWPQSFLYDDDGKMRIFHLPQLHGTKKATSLQEENEGTGVIMTAKEEQDCSSLLREQDGEKGRAEISSLPPFRSKTDQWTAGHEEAKALENESRYNPSVVGSLNDPKSSMDMDAAATTSRERVEEPELSKGTTQFSASANALVPVQSHVSIPPVWIDVCKAIMDIQKKNPGAFALLAANTVSRSPVTDEKPMLKRENKEDSQPRVVSDAKPAKPSGAEDEICKPKKRNFSRHRTEQEKLDRRERKRQKKEKRGRKKQKKAERKDRKRKTREQQNSLVEHHRSPHVNSAPKQTPAVNQPSRKDGKQEAFNASARREVKRQKIEEPRLSEGKPAGQGQTALFASFNVPPAEKHSSTKQSSVVQGEQDIAPTRNPAPQGRNNVSGKRTASSLELLSNSNRPDNLIDDDIEFDDDQGKDREKKLGKKEKKRRQSNEPSGDKLITVETSKPSRNGMLPTQMKRHATKHHPSEPSGRPKENVANVNREGWNDRPILQNTSQVPLVLDSSKPAGQDGDGPPLRALCSESFFEEWTDAIALLASGQWRSMCARSHAMSCGSAPSLGPKIQLFDTPLLEGGADIELPGHAIIVYRLTSWETSDIAKACARHLVRLTALEMYKDIDVFICADTEITPRLADNIAFVQNAVIAQNGINSKSPSFQVVAPKVLAPFVASIVLSTRTQGIPTNSFINASISDARVQERARFIRSITPSISVCGALQLLMCFSSSEWNQDDPTCQAFQQLMKSRIDRRLFGNDKLFEVNASALRQLSMAINASFV